MKVCLTAACAHGADVVFLLDASGSVGRRIFERVTLFVASLIEMLSPVSRVGLATFADSVSVEFQLDTFTSRDDMLHAVNVRYLGGATVTHDALRSVTPLLRRLDTLVNIEY